MESKKHLAVFISLFSSFHCTSFESLLLHFSLSILFLFYVVYSPAQLCDPLLCFASLPLYISPLLCFEVSHTDFLFLVVQVALFLFGQLIFYHDFGLIFALSVVSQFFCLTVTHCSLNVLFPMVSGTVLHVQIKHKDDVSGLQWQQNTNTPKGTMAKGWQWCLSRILHDGTSSNNFWQCFDSHCFSCKNRCFR